MAPYSSPRSRKLIRRSPIRHKPRRRRSGDNPAYRAFVRSFGCVVCNQGNLEPMSYWIPPRQDSSTECAHVGAKGLSQKCPDCESLPLCRVEHHQYGEYSHHVLGKRFWGFHGLDRADLIKQMQALYAESLGSTAGNGLAQDRAR